MEFSLDGAFLASGGQDAVIHLWKVAPPPPDASESALPVVEGTPYRSYKGHAHHVVDLAWSSTGFLLSASADKTVRPKTPIPTDPPPASRLLLLLLPTRSQVRLWHATRPDCLCLFQHPDVVASVAFHPVMVRATGAYTQAPSPLSPSPSHGDRRTATFSAAPSTRSCECGTFRTGGWCVARHCGRAMLTLTPPTLFSPCSGRREPQAQWCHTPEMVSAVAYEPSGRLAVAGLLNGLCVFYQSNVLTYYTQVECRNRHGRLSDGRKVTGISFLQGGKQVLVSTNDSRSRLLNMDDFSMQCKFKGVVNRHMQIRCTASESEAHVVCGSDDNRVCIWRTKHECAHTRCPRSLPAAPSPTPRPAVCTSRSLPRASPDTEEIATRPTSGFDVRGAVSRAAPSPFAPWLPRTHAAHPGALVSPRAGRHCHGHPDLQIRHGGQGEARRPVSRRAPPRHYCHGQQPRRDKVLRGQGGRGVKLS